MFSPIYVKMQNIVVVPIAPSVVIFAEPLARIPPI